MTSPVKWRDLSVGTTWIGRDGSKREILAIFEADNTTPKSVKVRTESKRFTGTHTITLQSLRGRLSELKAVLA